MTFTRKLVILLALAVSACGWMSRQEPTYSGEYFYNFENAFLTPDGKNEEWCLDGDMSKAELPAKDANGPWGTSHVVVRGELGPQGHFGGLGRCERVLKVTELVKVSNMRGRRAAP
jgi:hypothetical protein